MKFTMTLPVDPRSYAIYTVPAGTMLPDGRIVVKDTRVKMPVWQWDNFKIESEDG